MHRALRGDEDAYMELLVQLTGATRRYVRARAGTAVPWIDDVVQETLISVHRARHTFDPRRPFAPWFYAIAANRFVDVLRRQYRIRRHEIGGDTLPDAGTSDGRDQSPVDIDLVRQALAALPPRQREIVEAITLRDESVRDIAARLNLTAGAVKVTAHRGYRALRRALGVDLREE
jgi:RNA polymerase sigma-70 factor (ECF subfamily)